ncbi:MAG: PD-(D/E)XK nuclease domain-containing protein [Deltaproteobacteria bacterium]|nr:PD-(D/E)XK nuclease domain-containing protein [Candidatus Tharpella aukensis]
MYLFEFKVDGEGKALAQIKARNYQEKYLNQGKSIYLVGIDFDSEEKSVSGLSLISGVFNYE